MPKKTTAEPLPGGRRSGTPARALALLKGRPVARSAREIAEVVGASQQTVAEALKALRRRGLVEKIRCGTETRYRMARAAAIGGRAVSPILLGDRPRKLGLRAAWLRQHPPSAEAPDEPGLAEAAS
jgi:DNA-binding transcriptional ArsR family regulator